MNKKKFNFWIFGFRLFWNKKKMIFCINCMVTKITSMEVTIKHQKFSISPELWFCPNLRNFDIFDWTLSPIRISFFWYDQWQDCWCNNTKYAQFTRNICKNNLLFIKVDMLNEAWRLLYKTNYSESAALSSVFKSPVSLNGKG